MNLLMKLIGILLNGVIQAFGLNRIAVNLQLRSTLVLLTRQTTNLSQEFKILEITEISLLQITKENNLSIIGNSQTITQTI